MHGARNTSATSLGLGHDGNCASSMQAANLTEWGSNTRASWSGSCSKEETVLACGCRVHT
jgi:hypothetical protein